MVTLDRRIPDCAPLHPGYACYAVVIEKADGNYSAYVPDSPGCVAIGETVEAVETEIPEAIRFHIAGLNEDGLPIPAATGIADYVEA